MGRVVLLKRPSLLLAVLVTACSGFNPVYAQRMVKKLKTICPLGYVDTFNGKCSTLGLITYTVKPTNGEACPSGWMNVGGGYCRKK